MRHRLGLLALTLLLGALALPATTWAGASNSNAPGDFVVGGGENNPPEPAPVNHFAVNGHSDSDGSNPFGEAHFIDTVNKPVRRFNGEVVCVNVNGNRATIVFQFRNTLNQPAPLQDGWDIMFVEDNGDPVGGQSPDFVANDLHPSTDPVADCRTAPFRRAANPLTSGNVQVHDG